MIEKLGAIKVVEKWVHDFDPQGTGKKLETWWEVFDGSRWIGKAYTFKAAQHVSDDIKAGNWE